MVVLTIVLMAVVTYFTRVAGFLLVEKINLSKRALAVLEIAPACVLISVIAPRFVSDKPSEILALGLTVLLASRYSLLTTVIGAVVITAVLRAILG